jgi:hypothetical protein
MEKTSMDANCVLEESGVLTFFRWTDCVPGHRARAPEAYLTDMVDMWRATDGSTSPKGAETKASEACNDIEAVRSCAESIVQNFLSESRSVLTTNPLLSELLSACADTMSEMIRSITDSGSPHREWSRDARYFGLVAAMSVMVVQDWIHDCAIEKVRRRSSLYATARERIVLQDRIEANDRAAEGMASSSTGLFALGSRPSDTRMDRSYFESGSTVSSPESQGVGARIRKGSTSSRCWSVDPKFEELSEDWCRACSTYGDFVATGLALGYVLDPGATEAVKIVATQPLRRDPSDTERVRFIVNYARRMLHLHADMLGLDPLHGGQNTKGLDGVPTASSAPSPPTSAKSNRGTHKRCVGRFDKENDESDNDEDDQESQNGDDSESETGDQYCEEYDKEHVINEWHPIDRGIEKNTIGRDIDGKYQKPQFRNQKTLDACENFAHPESFKQGIDIFFFFFSHYFFFFFFCSLLLQII